jgi:predicted DNA-binding transcriptional regulator AlpA
MLVRATGVIEQSNESKGTKMIQPVISQYMRRKLVAHELGISRHTLARMIDSDGSFPRFFEITPGITVIARADFDHWLRAKRLASLEASR